MHVCHIQVGTSLHVYTCAHVSSTGGHICTRLHFYQNTSVPTHFWHSCKSGWGQCVFVFCQINRHSVKVYTYIYNWTLVCMCTFALISTQVYRCNSRRDAKNVYIHIYVVYQYKVEGRKLLLPKIYSYVCTMYIDMYTCIYVYIYIYTYM